MARVAQHRRLPAGSEQLARQLCQAIPVGLRVGTSITEGTANFLVNHRMNKSQQMRWSRRGADLYCRFAARSATAPLVQGSASCFSHMPTKTNGPPRPDDPPFAGHSPNPSATSSRSLPLKCAGNQRRCRRRACDGDRGRDSLGQPLVLPSPPQASSLGQLDSSFKPDSRASAPKATQPAGVVQPL